PQVHLPVAGDVSKNGPHRRGRFAVLSVGNACVGGDLLEGAVALVVEEEVFGFVVRNVNVRISVAVEVGGGYAHRASFNRRDTRLLRNICKGSVAVVVKQKIGIGFVVERAGIVVGRIKSPILRVELHIAPDEQVDTSIAIVVEPGRTDRPAAYLDA